MSDTFTYHGVELPYFDHMYNLTWLNERRIEVAIAHHWLNEIMGDDEHPTIWSDGLEVGNVLGHYDYHKHVVFDLHEEAAWYQKLGGQPVVSQDILAFDRTGSADRWEFDQFPWVVSISTIEHTDDPIKALAVLYSLVAPGGKLLVTFPTGISGILDQLVLGGAPNFDRMCTIGRTENGWMQTEWPEIREYGQWANSVFVGEWEAPL